MDSPLNRAHQQERKAEKFVSSKKYMEAVTCYEVAAALHHSTAHHRATHHHGYITEAMKATTASQALVSMQLQYQDHLRKQRILKNKIERLCQVKQISQDCDCPKDILNQTSNTDKAQKNLGVLTPEKSDSSLDSSLNSSQGVLVQAEDAISCHTEDRSAGTSVEDLQMQVLSLTQALEDSNRENNHLRNIVVKFKEVLHVKLGFSEEQIEELLINYDEEDNEHSSASESARENTHCESPDISNTDTAD